jgi:hypothetical protein
MEEAPRGAFDNGPRAIERNRFTYGGGKGQTSPLAAIRSST